MASLDSLAWFLDAPARVLGERHRWVSLALGVAVQLCAGTLYSVSAWGVALRDAAGWQNDEDLSLATTVGTLGVYLAVHNGLALDRFGARPCLAFASVALLLGWNLLARVASANGSPGEAAFALMLVGQGSVTSFLASLAPNVANFEEAHQGKAHGVLLAGFGGSSALFAAAYRGAFVGNLPGFFAFAGWGTALVAAANAFAVKDGAREKRARSALAGARSRGAYGDASPYAVRKRYQGTSGIRGIRLGSIGGRTRTSSPNAERDDDDDDEDERRLVEPRLALFARDDDDDDDDAHDPRETTTLPTTALDGDSVACSPSTVMRSKQGNSIESDGTARSHDEETAIAAIAAMANDDRSKTSSASSSAFDYYDANDDAARDADALFAHLKRLFRTPLFWLIYAHLTLTLGTALLWVNQAGSFAVAADDTVHAKSASLATMVTLFSLGNVFGRVSCGVAGDFCEARFATPRGAFLILGGLLMCLGAACLAGAPEREGTRNGVALTIGLAEGTIMAAWTSAVRRAFGEKRFGLHLAVYNSALALGSSLFNGFAAAATADESGDYGDGEVLGYKATFAIATTACGGATLLGVAIVKETTRDAALYSGAARRGDDVGG
jgi:hypothetical protein